MVDLGFDKKFPIFGLYPVWEYLKALKSLQTDEFADKDEIVSQCEVCLLTAPEPVHSRSDSLKKNVPDLFSKRPKDGFRRSRGSAYKKTQKNPLQKNPLKEQIEFLISEMGVSRLELSRAQMDQISKQHSHQGVMLFTNKPLLSELTLDSWQKRLSQSGSKDPMRYLLVLDGIDDVQNLGAIARTAIAFGIGTLLISADSSSRISPVAFRISAGAFAWMPVLQANNINRCCQYLSDCQIPLIATVTDYDAISLFHINQETCDKLSLGFALIIGNEHSGIRKSLRRVADLRLRIPMAETMDSLNASHSATAFLSVLKSKIFF